MLVEEEEHLDPTLEIDLETIKKRSVKGLWFDRQDFCVECSVAGGHRASHRILITLTIRCFLDCSRRLILWLIFGYRFGSCFNPKKENIEEEDLKTTFTVQQILVWLILIVMLALSPLIKSHYQLSQDGIWLFYAFGFSLLISSFKTIPSIILERKLEFGKLVIPRFWKIWFITLPR